MTNLAIVIPTYNEKENIQLLLPQLFEFSQKNKNFRFQVLIVDDNSPDCTAETVKVLQTKLKSEKFEILLQVRAKKDGLAGAYKFGMQKVLPANDWVLSMDADLSHRVVDITKFLEKIEDNDLIIGSRYIPGGDIENWNWFRRFVSSFASIYTQLILGVKIADYTGGFNLYRTSILQKIDFTKVNAQGYLFQIEMKTRMYDLGAKIKEVPILFCERKFGDSKFNVGIIWEASIGIWRIRSQRKNLKV